MKIWLKIFIISLSASLLFSQTRIRMELDVNIEFDLSLMLYPPPRYPAYYYPNIASPANPQGIYLIIGYQRIGPSHSVSTLYLSTRGSGDFCPSISLGQLYFAPDGEPMPPPGQDPPGGNWRSFSIFYQEIEQIRVYGPGFDRIPRPQDFIFKAEANDEPGIYTITLYYRLFGL
ncbi:MAG: hypothetical protein N3A65_06675 [candidate division WOR-3 bacterium]|nr:hypothetical protein [candidate division WOR-3 bacterium]